MHLKFLLKSMREENSLKIYTGVLKINTDSGV